MKEISQYYMESLKWLIIQGMHVITKKYYIEENKYGGKKLQSAWEGNEAIYRGIRSGEPFACCRYGYVEIDLAIAAWRHQKFGIPFRGKYSELGEIFQTPNGENEEGILKFGKIMYEAGAQADVLCLWENMKMSDYYVSRLPNVSHKVIAQAGCIEPFTRNEPWTRALKGKKVLVINPFASVIKKQYEKREKLFSNPDILPEFHLEVMDAVWYSQAGKDDRFKTWFEAYDYLFDQAMQKNFDIALLGCGLFGFPLAARLKVAGKQAIHMGSASQLLFGITGKRWKDSGGLDQIVNENWVTPPKELAPANPDKLDHGCYW